MSPRILGFPYQTGFPFLEEGLTGCQSHRHTTCFSPLPRIGRSFLTSTMQGNSRQKQKKKKDAFHDDECDEIASSPPKSLPRNDHRTRTHPHLGEDSPLSTDDISFHIFKDATDRPLRTYSRDNAGDASACFACLLPPKAPGARVCV